MSRHLQTQRRRPGPRKVGVAKGRADLAAPLRRARSVIVECLADDRNRYFFFFAIFNSANLATMSDPDDAGFTPLSMWRIFPSGSM